MGVEWHPVENSKLASAGASPYPTTFLDKPPTRCILQAGMVSSNSGIEGRILACPIARSSSHKNHVFALQIFVAGAAGIYGV